ncbi:MAG TPA: histidine triad nucleotide-binding protein [Burkholderiaceae bacterium]|jgi:histidine triad (HIT) family protein|nr:histidine triad nucleotide-binding protein [Burkholderiaceae bacterium]
MTQPDPSPSHATLHKADCLFCRIGRGEIPSRKVYEDDEILAFHDIHPSAPVHFLVIPKIHLDNLYDGDMRHQQLLGRMMGMLGQLATGEGATDGFRVVVNNGRVGRQEVYHLHIHVLGGPQPLGSGMNRQQ